MGNYFLGTKIINAALGNPTDPTLMDQADGELAAMLGPTEVGLIHTLLPDEGEWTWSLSDTHWTSAGGGGDYMTIPLPFRSGTIIKEIHLTVEVATNGGTDALELKRRHRTPVTGSMPAYETVATIDSDLWNGLTNGDATEMSYTGLTYALAAEYSYFLFLKARPAIICKIHEASVVIHRTS